MSEQTQLATKPDRVPVSMNERGVNFQSFDELARFSVAAFNSGLAPKGFGSPEAVMIAIQMGLELGVGPTQALQGIAVINGRPTVWGDLALAVIQSKPDFEDIHEELNADNTVATCTIKRRGKTPVVRKFSVDDAKKAGLLGKSGPWTQYQARMLQMRARSYAMRDSYADALRGVSIREEAQDIQPIKQATVRVVEPEKLKFADEAEPLKLEAGV